MISEFKEAIGAKLLNVVQSASGSTWLFVFEGGIVCQLGIDSGWERGDEEILEWPDFRVESYDQSKLLESGAVDAEYLRRHKEKREEELLQERIRIERENLQVYERVKAKLEAEAELQTYERLKAKFESQ